MGDVNPSTVRYVDHTYRDYSRYIEEGGQLIKHKKCEANFPAKVHKMLSDPRHEDIVTWMPHGRAWKILDKERLISTALPEYLVCRKYESFTRQLNGWGFKRLYQSGPDLGCYYHEAFLRGKPKLTVLIRRLPPNQGKSTPFPAGEPNFYRITEQYPLPHSAGSNDASAASRAEGSAGATSSESQSHEQPQNPTPSSAKSLPQESLADLAEAAVAAIPNVPQHQRPIAVAPPVAFEAPRQYDLHQIQHPPSAPTRPPPQEYPVDAQPPMQHHGSMYRMPTRPPPQEYLGAGQAPPMQPSPTYRMRAPSQEYQVAAGQAPMQHNSPYHRMPQYSSQPFGHDPYSEFRSQYPQQQQPAEPQRFGYPSPQVPESFHHNQGPPQYPTDEQYMRGYTDGLRAQSHGASPPALPPPPPAHGDTRDRSASFATKLPPRREGNASPSMEPIPYASPQTSNDPQRKKLDR